ncbi:hypothetical protein N7494_009912 [Penicillium frequentans]|uniref:mannan endo-1,6-alpha-mannosidase n=1 Tax=Penicillium frequentans TaxID=3151616 RepID=A0AAD6GBZ3_9EURO|nr:hypothetical protein N7494_009912 [Penicillium glabrum]
MIYCHLRYAIYLLSGLTRVSAIDLDINSTESIQNATAIEVVNLLSNSTLDGTVSPLYDDPLNSVKDEASIYMTLIPFWNATKNATYNNLIMKRMESQKPTVFNASFNSTNTKPSAAIWGLAAMAAAEVDFPTDSSESWLKCAANLHSKILWKNSQSCIGGLAPESPDLIGQQFGYFTGIYFQLTTRLAYASSGDRQRFFADRASAIWLWSVENQILDQINWSVSSLVAGTHNDSTCFVLKDWKLAASYGLWLSGAVYMFKITNTDLWRTRVDGLLDSTLTSFFTRNMIVEVGDLADGLGAVEQPKYSTQPGKGFLALWLASISILMPEVADSIDSKLRSTAVTLAQQCDGSSNHTVCGSDWTSSMYDEAPSFGNTLNVVNILVSNLMISKASSSVPKNTGNKTSKVQKANDTSPSNGDSATISDGAIASAVIGSVIGAAMILGAIFWGFRKWKDQTYGRFEKDEDGKVMKAKEKPLDPAEIWTGPSGATAQLHGSPIQELPNHVIIEMHEDTAAAISGSVRPELA